MRASAIAPLIWLWMTSCGGPAGPGGASSGSSAGGGGATDGDSSGAGGSGGVAGVGGAGSVTPDAGLDSAAADSGSGDPYFSISLLARRDAPGGRGDGQREVAGRDVSAEREVGRLPTARP